MKDALGDYLDAIAKYPLLSEEDEITLSRQIQAMLPLRDRNDLSPEEQKIVKRGERAFRKFYAANLRLPVYVAKKFRSLASHMEFIDLIQEGTMGLATAIEKFDHTRGYKFSTYAYWWIRQAITRCLQQKDRLIRLPSHAMETLNKAKKFARQYKQDCGVHPTLEQTRAHLNVQMETLKGYLTMSSDAFSLNITPASLEGEIELLSTIADEGHIELEEDLDRNINLEALDFMLSTLDDHDRDMMIHLFGLYGKPVVNMNEYGKKAGVSRESIRQRRNRAFNRMLLANRRWHAMTSQNSYSGNAEPQCDELSLRRAAYLRRASESYTTARLSLRTA